MILKRIKWYCDKCALNKGWPWPVIVRVTAVCDSCGDERVCNKRD